MMPMSQIDMVVSIDEAMLKVCGGFQLDVGRPSKRPDVHVVIRQGDVVATGQRAVNEDLSTWTVVVATDQQEQFTINTPAIACGVIIAEQERGGLEALSWVQEVMIRGFAERLNGPPAIPEELPVASPEGGQLQAGRAVSSSLTIVKESDPQGGETLKWSREVSIRKVIPAELRSPAETRPAL
jgi:hypothetical protein